jgi:hypothetical protein
VPSSTVILDYGLVRDTEIFSYACGPEVAVLKKIGRVEGPAGGGETEKACGIEVRKDEDEEVDRQVE